MYIDIPYDAWFNRMKEKYPIMLSKIDCVESPPGWNNILENMFESIYRYETYLQTKYNWKFISEEELETKYLENIYIFTQFIQIKMKFSSLRAYHTGGNKALKGIGSIIEQAEIISQETCSMCGSKRKEHFLKHLCDKCKMEI